MSFTIMMGCWCWMPIVRKSVLFLLMLGVLTNWVIGMMEKRMLHWRN